MRKGKGFGLQVDGIIEQSLVVEGHRPLVLPGAGVPTLKDGIGRRTRNGDQEFSSINESPVVQAGGGRVEIEIGSFQPARHVPDT